MDLTIGNTRVRMERVPEGPRTFWVEVRWYPHNREALFELEGDTRRDVTMGRVAEIAGTVVPEDAEDVEIDVYERRVFKKAR